ncbi:MAG: DUF1727 domain-containing protein [Dehalococcoidia bacterium]|nr:DUF1727 domain-containing protein [Dehalococcoidia bacterium]
MIQRLAAGLGQGVVLVSGTNGKTTTCRILADLLTAAGLHVVHNRTGSNLMRGIAAALVNTPQGELGPNAIGLFEVDEATLPEAVARLSPRLVVLLNLFRDQLDRYGEVDAIVGRWRAIIATLPVQSSLALNADDPMVAGLGSAASGTTVYFGVNDPSAGQPELEHAADFVECLACGTPYDYTVTYFGHLGHYRCPTCGWQRPPLDVECTTVRSSGLAGSQVTVQADGATVEAGIPLPGLYNVYNLLGALAALRALQLPLGGLAGTLHTLQPVFGRADRVQVGDKAIVTLLTKNPVGANQVLRALAAEPGQKALLLALNDGVADGQDVSWIWDVDYELLRGQIARVITSGRRAADMALRLKHAHWFEGDEAPSLEALPDLQHALQTSLYQLLPGQTLYVLPTYTAMLYLRDIMTRLDMTRPYWQEALR